MSLDYTSMVVLKLMALAPSRRLRQSQKRAWGDPQTYPMILELGKKPRVKKTDALYINAPPCTFQKFATSSRKGLSRSSILPVTPELDEKLRAIETIYEMRLRCRKSAEQLSKTKPAEVSKSNKDLMQQFRQSFNGELASVK